jgi:hypothetical protein
MDRVADQEPWLLRLLGGLAGMIAGAPVGLLCVTTIIMIAKSTLGLTNVWPGAAVGSLAGLVCYLGNVGPSTIGRSTGSKKGRCAASVDSGK